MALQADFVLGRHSRLAENRVFDFHYHLAAAVFKQITVLTPGQLFHQAAFQHAGGIVLRIEHVHGAGHRRGHAWPFKACGLGGRGADCQRQQGQQGGKGCSGHGASL